MASVPYKSAVGTLMHLMVGTRPDIAYAVNIACRFMSNPGRIHWKLVKRIFRYLKGTSDFGLVYGSLSDNELVCYCDADWGGDKADRKSTTGCIFLMNGGAISWYTTKQATVALSTTEAEYMAMTEALKEVLWFRTFLSGIGLRCKGPSIIRDDSTGAISLTKTGKHHSRTKHIDIKYHFIRDHIDDKSVDVVYCQTQDQLADMLTKALPGPTFIRHRKNAGLMSLKDFDGLPARGSVGKGLSATNACG